MQSRGDRGRRQVGVGEPGSGQVLGRLRRRRGEDGLAGVEVVEDQALGQFEQGVAGRERARGPRSPRVRCTVLVCAMRIRAAGEVVRPVRGLPATRGRKASPGEMKMRVPISGVVWKFFSVTQWCMKQVPAVTCASPP
ncbi:hypothetical protein AB0J21_16455 [Streptomyces sp. NPDC049954]|uniref:hypothetical protein n=1 Tax=Streptomyces sp. NPDC049954 TaxID=3155779 RepID=UPI003426E7A2